MSELSKLMQLGEHHWTELAACLGDPRFTQKEPPDPSQARQLSAICRDCDVFFDCLKFHEECSAIAVFAHGEWRYDSAAPDSDTVHPPADEC